MINRSTGQLDRKDWFSLLKRTDNRTRGPKCMFENMKLSKEKYSKGSESFRADPVRLRRSSLMIAEFLSSNVYIVNVGFMLLHRVKTVGGNAIR